MNQQTADKIIEKAKEKFPSGGNGMNQFVYFINSLVSEDEDSLPIVDNINCQECGDFVGVGSLYHVPKLVSEDKPIEIDEMGDCPFCHNPYIRIETDNQIVKRMIEKAIKEVEDGVEGAPIYTQEIPDWLNQRED